MQPKMHMPKDEKNWEERANVIHWPPILYTLAAILPWVLQIVLPLPAVSLSGIVADGPLVDILLPIGLAFGAIGITVGILALRSFAGAGTPFDPTAKAEKLVTFGLYNRTRNPMYLAGLIAFFGLALADGNLWRMIAVPLLFIGLQHFAVVPEEKHLEARFGESWREYAAKVKRWW